MRDVEFKRLMILDGYNVIYKISELSGTEERSLREKRNALISFMRKWQEIRKYKGKICIVFDGQDGVFGGSGQSVYGINCIFTKTKEEADDRILSIIKNTKNTSGIVVVSDDNYVMNNCRAHSVDVKPVSFLIQAPRGKSRQKSDDSSEKKIDEATKNAINRELKEKWGIE